MAGVTRFIDHWRLELGTQFAKVYPDSEEIHNMATNKQLQVASPLRSHMASVKGDVLNRPGCEPDPIGTYSG